jgi:hypothetical protein
VTAVRFPLSVHVCIWNFDPRFTSSAPVRFRDGLIADARVGRGKCSVRRLLHSVENKLGDHSKNDSREASG